MYTGHHIRRRRHIFRIAHGKFIAESPMMSLGLINGLRKQAILIGRPKRARHCRPDHNARLFRLGSFVRSFLALEVNGWLFLYPPSSQTISKPALSCTCGEPGKENRRRESAMDVLVRRTIRRTNDIISKL